MTINTIDVYREMLNHSLAVTLVTDSERNYVYSNETFKKTFGYTEEQLSSHPVMELLLPKTDFVLANKMKTHTLANATTSTGFLPIKAADGKFIEMYVRCSAIANGQLYIWSGTDAGILEHTQSELIASLKEEHNNLKLLQMQKDRLDFALDCALTVTWELDTQLKHLEFSDNFEKALGIIQADYDYDFTRFVDIHLNPYKEVILERISDFIQGKTEMFIVEVTLCDREQNLHWFIIRGKFLDEKKNLIFGVSVDITEQKVFEQRLAELAYKDILTGLYKMEYVTDTLAGLTEGEKLQDIGLMVFDIKHFRNINEAFGHKCGNDVLKYVAARLKELMKDRMVIRVGGDEYLVVFNHVTDAAVIREAAEQMLKEFEEPLDIEGTLYYINFKVGIALAEEKDIDFTALLRDAEIALHQAKKDEINDIYVIKEEIRQKVDSVVSLEFELRRGITRKEFYLDFQPVISVKDHSVIGMEALVRWKHPIRGNVPPLEFIPLAEECGLIVPLGDFVLEDSMRKLQGWLKINPNIYVAINVSTIQFMTHNFIERIKELMDKYTIPSRNLVIEVTESVFISEASHIVNILKVLQDMGIRVSLDDFGTCYSSLSYLKKIPLDNLKIDRDFLLDVLEDPVSDAILKSIITLAQNLKLTVTAEGVETKEQLSLLEKYDCTSLQGFYFSRPVDPQKIEEFISLGTVL